MVVVLSWSEAPSWVAARLAQTAVRGGSRTRWVGVDGLGGAGKSSLATAIAAAVPQARVVSVDDFARAGLLGWDRALFVTQVLQPLLAGRSARYQRWDLLRDEGLDWVVVPPGLPVIVEGVSATDVRVPVPWDLTLWVDVPAEERRRRIAVRDPPALMRRWEEEWWPPEEEYAREQRPWDRVSAVVVPAVGESEPVGP